MKHAVGFLVIHFFFTVAMMLINNNNQKSFNFKKTFLSFFTTLIFLILNYEYANPAFRIIFNFFIYMWLAHWLFEKNIRESILLGLFTTLLGIIAECIYVMITIPFSSRQNVLTTTPLIVLLDNFFIGVILCIISSIKRIKKLYINILDAISKIRHKTLVAFSLAIIVIFNFICWIGYLTSEKLLGTYSLQFLGSMLSIFSAILIFNYFKANNKYISIYEKYNVSLQSIREFETTLENYRINTHESRNQLRTIRNMSKEKSVNSYIDSLLNEDFREDEKILNEVQKLPNGGLRGIIYSKIAIMNKNNIPFELVVDKTISYQDIEKINDVTLTDICKILGVFLDNAIEAVTSLEEKYILIELYQEEGETVISVTNNYEGYIDIENMNIAGISTKGEGRGHGLALVNQVVKKNKKIEHDSNVTEDSFMQTIKIKV